jgi:hypothetical protein
MLINEFIDSEEIIADPECEYNFDDWINPFFKIIEYDGHKDTPVEILHTFLLGFVKYLARLCASFLKNMPEKKVGAIALINEIDYTGDYFQIIWKYFKQHLYRIFSKTFWKNNLVIYWFYGWQRFQGPCSNCFVCL